MNTICYETFGNHANPCIILIMGTGGQLISWPALFIQGLADQGFYVVIFDNRDAGFSHYYDELGTPNLNEAITAKQQGKDFHPPYTLGDMASDVIGLMNELHIEKAHIAGISMGGMISQIVALEYPKRVLSLTCIASTSGDPLLPPAKSEVLEYFFAPQKQEDGVESCVNNRMKLHKIYMHPEHVDEKKDRVFYEKFYRRAHHPAGFKRQLLAVIFAESRVDRLKQLRIPSLIIHGDYDPCFPIEHGKQLVELLPQSRLETIPKMGHGLPDCLCEKLVGICNDFYKSG